MGPPARIMSAERKSIASSTAASKCNVEILRSQADSRCCTANHTEKMPRSVEPPSAVDLPNPAPT